MHCLFEQTVQAVCPTEKVYIIDSSVNLIISIVVSLYSSGVWLDSISAYCRQDNGVKRDNRCNNAGYCTVWWLSLLTRYTCIDHIVRCSVLSSCSLPDLNCCPIQAPASVSKTGICPYTVVYCPQLIPSWEDIHGHVPVCVCKKNTVFVGRALYYVSELFRIFLWGLTRHVNCYLGHGLGECV